jgi:AAA domain
VPSRTAAISIARREVAQFAVGHLVDELKQRWRDVPRIEAWLDAALEDMIENLPRLRSQGPPDEALPERLSEGLRHGGEAFSAATAPMCSSPTT